MSGIAASAREATSSWVEIVDDFARMLFHRKHGGGPIPKKQLVDTLNKFNQGQCISLMTESADCDERAAVGWRWGKPQAAKVTTLKESCKS